MSSSPTTDNKEATNIARLGDVSLIESYQPSMHDQAEPTPAEAAAAQPSSAAPLQPPSNDSQARRQAIMAAANKDTTTTTTTTTTKRKTAKPASTTPTSSSSSSSTTTATSNPPTVEIIPDVHASLSQLLPPTFVDVILWKDTTLTALSLLCVSVLSFLLILGFPVLHLATQILLIACAASFLFVNGSYAYHIYVKKLPADNWTSPLVQHLPWLHELPFTRADVHQWVRVAVLAFVELLELIRRALAVHDNLYTLKALAALYLATFVTRLSLPAAVLIAASLLFTIPVLYHTYKAPIDQTLGKGINQARETSKQLLDRIPRAKRAKKEE